MNIKYIAISLTAIFPLCLTANEDWTNEEAAEVLGVVGSGVIATPEQDKKNQEEDNDVAALELALGLPSKAFIKPEERKKKVEKMKKKSGYKTSARSGAQIDEGMVFATGSSSLSTKTRQRVSVLAKAYKAHSGIIKQILITGHTDIVGNDNSNLILSNSRANSVKKELVLQGVPASLVVAKGYGERALLPNIPGTSGANRRVEYSVEKRDL